MIGKSQDREHENMIRTYLGNIHDSCVTKY